MIRDEDTITAVSLFSGLGGLDIGLHEAGIETVACVEKNEYAAETLKINSTKHDNEPSENLISAIQKYPWTVIQKDIRNIDAEDILAAANISKQEIDLVIGGPPCQTFSRSNEGYRAGTNTERGKLYQEYAKILHQLQPTAFIFENVRGLTSSNNGKDLKTIQTTLEGDTYQSAHQILNAADFGVPQTRKRLFILGTRNGQRPSFPTPTHSKPDNSKRQSWVTVGDALAAIDIDKQIEEAGGYRNAIGSKYGPLLKDIPEGANYQHFSERKYDPDQQEYVERDASELDEKWFDWRSRHWNYLLKIDRDRPSWTIQAAPGTTVGPFHWRSRKLSLLEQMKLMDLPLDYYIAGPPSEIQTQIGNAVPPQVANAVARQLAHVLDLTLTRFSVPAQPKEPHSTDEPTPFVVEITSDDSPWHHANRLIHAIRSDAAGVVKARQRTIPYAIDTIEIAKRQTEIPLNIAIDERTIEDEHAKGGVASVLEAKVTAANANILHASESRLTLDSD